MGQVIIKMLDPEQYYLLEEFCETENIAMLNPEWSKVVAAIDVETAKVVGIMVAQMQTHVEPIWIKEGYRDGKISSDLSDALDGYLDMLSLKSGMPIGVWCNPTNAAAERICRSHGYTKLDKPIYTKVYPTDRLTKNVTPEEE